MVDFSSALISNKELERHIFLPHISPEQTPTKSFQIFNTPRVLKNPKVIYGLEQPNVLALIHAPNESSTVTHKTSKFGLISSGGQNYFNKSLTPKVGSQISALIKTESNIDLTSFRFCLRSFSKKLISEPLLTSPKSNIPLESFKEQAKKKKKQIKEEAISARRMRLLADLEELRQIFKKKGKLMTMEDMLRKGMVEKGEKKLNRIQSISRANKLLIVTNKYGRNTINKHLRYSTTSIKEQKNEQLKEVLEKYLDKTNSNEKPNIQKVKNGYIPNRLLMNYK